MSSSKETGPSHPTSSSSAKQSRTVLHYDQHPRYKQYIETSHHQAQSNTGQHDALPVPLQLSERGYKEETYT